MNVTVPQSMRSLEISAVVTRCGCTEQQKSRVDWHGKHNQVCPRPRGVEDRGTIVRWNRNPLRQALNRVRRAFGKV